MRYAKMLWPVMFAATVLAMGCTAQTAYRMTAVDEVVRSLDQLETALDESATSLHGRMALERENLWTAYQVDLVGVLAKPPEEAAKELVRLALKYRSKESEIVASRAAVDGRFARAAEHSRFMRETLADVYSLEESGLSAQEKLERYRALATDYARRKFGLVALPAVAPVAETLAMPVAVPAAE